MKPVDPVEAPDYYKVIKEPMGKEISLDKILTIFFIIHFQPALLNYLFNSYIKSLEYFSNFPDKLLRINLGSDFQLNLWCFQSFKVIYCICYFYRPENCGNKVKHP